MTYHRFFSKATSEIDNTCISKAINISGESHAGQSMPKWLIICGHEC